MKEYFEVLRKCPLFYGIENENFQKILECLGAKVKSFRKKETIIAEGEPAKYIGIILSGAAQIVRVDYFGNRSIVADVGPSELFGESFACADIDAVPVDVVAAVDTKVMLADCLRITRSCSNECLFHGQLVYNLMKVIAEKNLMFHQKIEITSRRTTREKLTAYLLQQAKKHNSNVFEIPYSRQELAEYLEVERTGLSVEISKLCKQGFIETDRKSFTILRNIDY
ncbi:MAG: Crp/Fnr family transcriptional regulator [Schaedlerella sp.]|nr:Crp/Fnr family transcriptional regulator [Lachnospiraceae bacterium]MDY4201724.1 Crp/Fnr family transcriptional regulator [Schaedlerella sp.]